MNFLTPQFIAIAAALTVPPLVALYFLKLRRQEVAISSTFFWKRAVQDLQVNAPFQKLRRNLLMFLQLLVLLLAALALGQPLLRKEQTSRKSLILLMDRSASMNVVEPDGKTRLERAKQAAIQQIEQVGSEFDRAMVIAFSDRAKMMTAFTSNRNILEDAIDRITPSDGLSSLREAVALAEAHSELQIVEAEGITATPVPTGPPAQAVLFSDGRIADAVDLTLQRMSMKIVRDIAVSSDNVGIVSLTASRNYQRPEILNIVAGIQNFGPSGVEFDVQLFIEGEPRDIQTLTLEPGIAPLDAENFDVGKAFSVVAFDEIEFADSGVIEVRLSRPDKLPIDNRAYAVIDPPGYADVLLVSEGNFALKKVLDALPLTWRRMSPGEYESAVDEEIAEGGRSRFDVVIFDGCTSARLPTGNYMFFGALPTAEGFEFGELVEFDRIFNWDETHPIMRHVAPHNIDILSYRKPILPSNAESLIDGEQGPVVSMVNHLGNRYLICAFGLLDEARESLNTTWPYRTHFVFFVGNAIQYFSGGLAAQSDTQTRPGESLAIKTIDVATQVQVQRPDGTTDSVTAGSNRMAHYGATDRVGIYTASPTLGGSSTYAVNLFSPEESRIAPNAEFAIGGEPVEGRSSTQLANVPLWPWFVLGVLAFLFVEWAVYSRRIMV